MAAAMIRALTGAFVAADPTNWLDLFSLETNSARYLDLLLGRETPPLTIDTRCPWQREAERACCGLLLTTSRRFWKADCRCCQDADDSSTKEPEEPIQRVIVIRCGCGIWSRRKNSTKRAGGRLGTVVELGPGDSLGTGLAALLSGAYRYIAVDVVRHANSQQNMKVFEELVSLFANRAPIPSNKEFPEVKPHIDDLRFPASILDDGSDGKESRLEAASGNRRLSAWCDKRQTSDPICRSHDSLNGHCCRQRGYGVFAGSARTCRRFTECLPDMSGLAEAGWTRVPSDRFQISRFFP